MLQKSDILRCLTHTFSHKLYNWLVVLQCVGECDVKNNQDHLQTSNSSPLWFLHTYVESRVWHVLWMVDVRSVSALCMCLCSDTRQRFSTGVLWHMECGGRSTAVPWEFGGQWLQNAKKLYGSCSTPPFFCNKPHKMMVHLPFVEMLENFKV